MGTHWIALNAIGDNLTHFGSSGVEHIPKQIKKFISNKYIMTNFYRTQANVSIIYGYFWIGFIDFMLKSKSLLDYTDSFSLNEHEQNDKIIPKYLQ